MPTYQDLLMPLLELLSESNHSRKSASEILINNFNLSPEEKALKISSGVNQFENRLGWAFTYLTKAEYIELTERRAIYKITDLGKQELKKAKENKISITTKYLQENSQNFENNWRVIKNKSDNFSDENENIASFDLEDELDKVENEFDTALLNKIKQLSWQEFEDLCANLLERMGYGVASKRKIRVGDGGIDGEIYEDELGIKGKIYIQAKKWDSGTIQPKDMKEFLYNVRENKGVFITTSDFSQKSKEEAQNYKDGKIALINHQDLIKLCKKYQVLCEKQTIYIYKLA